MSVVKHFVSESMKKTEIDEFMRSEFERAGYGGVDIAKTPLGTHIVVYAVRPGLIIGRGGETIKELATIFEQKFQLPNPQISVAEMEVPEFNAYVIASRVASALKRGVHFRRAGFWALQQVMDAGALGAEIIISGKLRTERSRFEKFRDGYLPKSGDPAIKHLYKAELHVKLKPGILGIKVRIMPSNVPFPDQVEITEISSKEENMAKEEPSREPEKPDEKDPQETEVTKNPKKETEISEKEAESALSEENAKEVQ
jgi:small subunit ribosomal protein S3